MYISLSLGFPFLTRGRSLIKYNCFPSDVYQAEASWYSLQIASFNFLGLLQESPSRTLSYKLPSPLSSIYTIIRLPSELKATAASCPFVFIGSPIFLAGVQSLVSYRFEVYTSSK